MSPNGSRTSHEVAVIGAGPGWPRNRLLPCAPGPPLRDPRWRRCHRFRLAGPLGLADACSPRAATTACPGLAFPGDPEGYPTARRGGRLPGADYAATLRAPGRTRTAACARSVAATAATLSSSTTVDLRADQVVIATGPFQTPRVPAFAEGLGPEVVQLHSSAYRSPSDHPRGAVLVVGGGNTGFQIAEELVRLARGPPLDRVAADAAAAAHPRPRPVLVPRRDRPDPQDDGHRGSASGWRARHADRLQPARAARAATASSSTREPSKPRGSTVSFSDGTQLDVGTVDLGDRASGSTTPGSTSRCSTRSGRVVHQRGVTESPGLYFLGLSWQHTQGLGAARLGQGRRRVHRASRSARSAERVRRSAARRAAR